MTSENLKKSDALLLASQQGTYTMPIIKSRLYSRCLNHAPHLEHIYEKRALWSQVYDTYFWYTMFPSKLDMICLEDVFGRLLLNDWVLHYCILEQVIYLSCLVCQMKWCQIAWQDILRASCL